ncbi:MAG: hypothetical protein BGO61_03300 [Thiobacillus sp. 65-69]|nr:MAG: hypothetical protein ABT21_06965 [Thiobacillus sp. SCN 65-179]OJW37382.1 MAG: hypothetical protein BGO61_03300 [Thiobacillus sp. 65-69]
MSQTKSVDYNLQVSIDSLLNDRVLNIDSSMPFNSMSIGDKFYASGETEHWFSDGKTPKVLYVVDVAHRVVESPEVIFNQVFIALSREVPRNKM